MTTSNQEPAGAPQILITDVSIFDGTSDELTTGQSVLVEGNLIKSVGRDLAAGSAAIVIDGAGRTLTPGLIDMHQHLMLGGPDGLYNAQSMDFATIGAVAAQSMYAHLLMKGITTVRDITDSIHPHPTMSETIPGAGDVFHGLATEVYKPKRAESRE